ncbi:MAG: HD domain-containing phosphohydrolase [bacterium]
MTMKTGQYFVSRGLVTEKNLVTALEYQKKNKGYIGEILYHLDFITEANLLLYLSQRFNVQYISSEKLEKIPVQRPADIMPEHLAFKHNIYPLKYDFSNYSLTLLTHEPQNIVLFDDLKVILSGVNTITPIVAASNAVKALNFKQYKNDFTAFERLVRKGIDIGTLMPERESVIGFESVGSLSSTIQDIISEEMDNEKSRTATFSAILNQGQTIERSSATASMVSLMPGLVQHNQLIEVIRVFTNLLDSLKDSSFFGHTQRVVTLSQELGEEMSLTDVELHDLLLAAYLHDVGKKFHYSALDIKQSTNHDKLIKSSTVASRLFSKLDFPKLTLSYLSNMYETYYGSGVPSGLSLSEVPTGSLILLLADSYDFLSRVLRLPPTEALRQLKGLRYFPDKLIDALVKVEQIETMPKSTNLPSLKGLIISRNRFGCDEISNRLNRLNVKTYKVDMFEKAAQIIKEKHYDIDFILCDFEMPESNITPIKFLSALRRKKEFSSMPFYFFATFSLDANSISAAKALKATGVFQNYHPVGMTQRIVEDMNRIKKEL